MIESTNHRAALVVADELLERGDIRGELIVIESRLAWMVPSDAGYAGLVERAGDLRKKALRAWQKQLHTKTFKLDRGVPAVAVRLGSRAPIPNHPWLLALNVIGRPDGGAKKGTRDAHLLAALMKTPRFARIRRLTLEKVKLTLDEIAALCASNDLDNLAAFDFPMRNQSAAALVTVLGSTGFERLAELSLELDIGAEDSPDLENVDGLPALRKLELQSVGHAATERLLRSPLAQRLEVLVVSANASSGAPLTDTYGLDACLPALRHLDIGGAVADMPLWALAHNRTLATLEYLDLGKAHTEAPLESLAHHDDLPSLKALRINEGQRAAQSRATIRGLERRFGAHFIIT
jgi:hypothetical protein